MGLIRLILALSVVITHSSPSFGVSIVGGQMAVQSFYIISGFYMSLILNEKYKKGSYKLFITNRFLRLYPIYWCVLILSVIWCIIMYCTSNTLAENSFAIFIQYFHNLKFSTFIYLVLSNIFVFGQDVALFLGLDPGSGGLFFTENFRLTNPHLHSFIFIPQAWTIGLELMFYLIAPFLVRRKTWLILLLIALTLSLKLFMYNSSFNHDPWTYRFFPAELLFFLLGKISYDIYTKIRTVQIPRVMLWGTLFSVLLVTIFYCWLPFNKPYLYFIGFFLSLPLIFILSKKSKIDTYIGELSYPIYISHVFLLLIIQSLKIPFIESKGTTLIIFSVLFSILLNVFITSKIEKVRQKRVLKFEGGQRQS